MPLPRFDGEITEKDFFFTMEKQFSNSHLVKPPNEFIDFISSLENIFTEHFDSTCHRVGFSQILFEKMVDVDPYLCCENCNPNVLKYIFIRIRTYFLINSFNKKANEPNFKNIKFLCITHH